MYLELFALPYVATLSLRLCFALRTDHTTDYLFAQFGNHGVDCASDEILHRRGIRQRIFQQEPSFEFSPVHGQPVLLCHSVVAGPVERSQ